MLESEVKHVREELMNGLAKPIASKNNSDFYVM